MRETFSNLNQIEISIFSHEKIFSYETHESFE